MKINLDATYDPKSDAFYVVLRDTPPEKTMQINETTLLDFDKDGKVVGVEILGYGRWEPPKAGVKQPLSPSPRSTHNVLMESEQETLKRWVNADKPINRT